MYDVSIAEIKLKTDTDHPLNIIFHELLQAEFLYKVGGHITAIHPALTVKVDSLIAMLFCRTGYELNAPKM